MKAKFTNKVFFGRFRVGLCILSIALAFLIQTSVFPLIPFMAATPNLLLICTFSFGFIQGSAAGMLYGLGAGLLQDMFYSGPFGFYSLIYVALGYITGMFSRFYYEEYVTLPLFICAVSELVYHSYIYVFRFLVRGKLDLLYYLWHIVLPSTLFSLLVTLALYKVFFVATKKINRL